MSSWERAGLQAGTCCFDAMAYHQQTCHCGRLTERKTGLFGSLTCFSGAKHWTLDLSAGSRGAPASRDYEKPHAMTVEISSHIIHDAS